MKIRLLLCYVLYLMPVLAWIAFTRDVNPVMVGGFRCAFEDSLVEVGVIHKPDEPGVELGHVR